MMTLEVQDAFALMKAQTWPVLPYEKGGNLICDLGYVEYVHENESFWSPDPLSPPTDDPCAINTKDMDGLGVLWGTIHTHPVFTNPNMVTQYTRGKGCRDWNAKTGGSIPSVQQIQDTMDAGEDWSPDDKVLTRCKANTPAYLRNTISVVKKLVGSVACVWIEDRNLP